MSLSGYVVTTRNDCTPSGSAFCIGDDGKHYVPLVDSNGSSVSLVIVDAEDNTIPLTRSSATWSTDLAGLSGFTPTGTFKPGNIIPIPGTSKFIWSGYSFNTDNSTGDNLAMGIIYQIVDDATLNVIGGFCYGAANNHELPDEPQFCYAAQEVDGVLYAAAWIGFTISNNGFVALLALPVSGTHIDLTTTAWAAQYYQLPYNRANLNTNSGRLFSNPLSIAKDPNGIGVFHYIGVPEESTWGVSAPKLEYCVVDLADHVTIPTATDVSASYGVPFSDSGKTYAGTTSSNARDDYTCPSISIIGGVNYLMFCRSFSDNNRYARMRRAIMDPASGVITSLGTVDFQLASVTVTGTMDQVQAYQEGLTVNAMMDNNVTYYFGTTTVPELPAAPVTGAGPSVSTNRAWSFVLDGHTMYALDLGDEGTFVYDIVTRQWSKWSTSGFVNWDVVNGTMWGDRIVGGDLSSTDVWEVVLTATTDNGSLDISHVVTGGVQTRSRTKHSVDAVRLAYSAGLLDETTGGTIYLRWSDDGGQTWSTYRSITLSESDYSAEVAWRALGAFAAPGRVFEISDTGGPLRIDGCDAGIDGMEDPPAQPGG